MTKNKTFRLSPDQIKQLITVMGSCMATDMITVEGRKVGFMYREEPQDDIDSGWRFMAGAEPPLYMDDPDNLAVYDVNTIANYDSDIIPILNSPIESAFERDPNTGIFVQVDFNPPDDGG